MIISKCRPWRSEKYKKFIKENMPCPFDWLDGCQGKIDFHHIKSRGHLSGAGMTAPDYAGFSICRKHHDMLPGSQMMKDAQFEYALRVIGAAIDAGVLIVYKEKK